MIYRPGAWKDVVPLVVVAVMLAVLTGCGAKIIHGEAPFVKINALLLDAGTVQLDLGLRNINDVPLQIENIDFRISLEDSELAGYSGARAASVIANGRETLRFELPASAAGADLLMRLERDDLGGLPYTLEGTLMVSGEKEMSFEGKGHLYPVPGRPGQFR
jgi:LEA14-like dessication related protein